MIINRKSSFKSLLFYLHWEFLDTNLKWGKHLKDWAADIKQIYENKVSYLQDCD